MQNKPIDSNPSPDLASVSGDSTPIRNMVIRVGSVDEELAFQHWRQRLKRIFVAIGVHQANLARAISELAGVAEHMELYEVLNEAGAQLLWDRVEAFEDTHDALQGETERAATVLDEVSLQMLQQPKTREKVDIRSVNSITELYRLRPHLVARALKNTKVEPQIDAFSLEQSKQCSRWWGPDSDEGVDAFQQCWSNDILWCNPPYSQMAKVVAKLREDRAHCLLVAPEWSTRTWWQQLQPMVVWRWRIPAGSKAFELYNRACGPTRWAVQVLAICGAEYRCTLLHLRAGVVHGPRLPPERVAQIKMTTTSKKRRLRRQRLKELQSKTG